MYLLPARVRGVCTCYQSMWCVYLLPARVCCVCSCYQLEYVVYVLNFNHSQVCAFVIAGVIIFLKVLICLCYVMCYVSLILLMSRNTYMLIL